jgi:hypothetical protein
VVDQAGDDILAARIGVHSANEPDVDLDAVRTKLDED